MKPARAFEDLGPIDLVRLDMADGGMAAVVQHSAGARRGSVFNEVDSHPVSLRPDHMARVDPELPGLVLRHPAQCVGGQPAHPARGEAQSRNAGGHGEFGSTDAHLEVRRLFQPFEVRRRQAKHGLAEGYDVRHIGLLAAPLRINASPHFCQ
ncbi:MAG: hypothetical protein A2Z37_08600 [Chloroflexi bacterium RBG_19FT_COMBO_62_14]|nr:MAG: hypothetical protein A2Z37_08600 [Chloroflexi bacterium RBG_19FT_COMBO_62_14]